MAKIEINYRNLLILFLLVSLYFTSKDLLSALNLDGIYVDIVNIVYVMIGVYLLPTIMEIKSRKSDEKLVVEMKRIRNLIRLILFVSVVIYLVVSLTRDPILGVASSTVIGLVFGLALQPILSNMFSGLIILSTGYIKVGEVVRILTSQVPYQAALLPPYKFFSREEIPIGYKGTIKEIGIFYTTIKLVTGVNLKLPNSILLNSGIIEKAEKNEVDKKLIRVRFEFPMKKIDDIEKLVKKIKDNVKKIKDLKRVEVLISEQSDKENIIIELKIDSIAKEHKKIKSKVLKELFKIWKEITKDNQNAQQ